MRRRARLLALVACATLVACPAVAQTFGRWWLEGSVGLGQRRTRVERDDRVTSDNRQQELRLALALHGFVLHPTVGEFRLGVDLLLSEYEGGQRLDTDRTGFDAELSLLPRGAYPARLYARRQLYDYSRGEGQSLALLRAPDTTTSVGGRFRVRKGPLRGLLVGAERTSFEILDRASEDELQERQFVDWSRPGGPTRHHLRLEHRLRDYGDFGLRVDDWTASIDESGRAGELWNWQISGLGIRRAVESRSREELETDSLRLRQRWYRPVREADLLDLSASLGLERPDAGSDLESYGASVFYRWRPGAAIEVAPFAQYLERRSDRFGNRGPRAGLSVSWTRDGTLQSLLSARASFGEIERRVEDVTDRESQTSIVLSGSLAHGDADGLRKELEVEVGRNELRLARDPLLDLPDLGTLASGDEDYLRGRVTVGHRWDSKWLRGWVEGSRIDAAALAVNGGFRTDTLSGAVQHGGADYSLQVSAGDVEVQRPDGTQTVRYSGLAATWTPRRGSRVRVSYRRDQRQLVLAPRVDGERLEALLQLGLGQLTLEVGAFATSERLAGEPDRENRGVNWTVRRGFAAWLPIVTGSRRKGVIR